jgi:hypothetical protein
LLHPATKIGLRDAESRNAKDKLAGIAVKRVGRYACIGLGAHDVTLDAFLPPLFLRPEISMLLGAWSKDFFVQKPTTDGEADSELEFRDGIILMS